MRYAITKMLTTTLTTILTTFLTITLTSNLDYQPWLPTLTINLDYQTWLTTMTTNHDCQYQAFDKISKTLLTDWLTDSPTWIQEMLAHLKIDWHRWVRMMKWAVGSGGVPGGQWVGPQGPRGSKGRPTGSPRANREVWWTFWWFRHAY